MRKSVRISKKHESGRATLPNNIATATSLNLTTNWTLIGKGGFGTVYTSKEHPDIAIKTSALNRCAKLNQEYNIVTSLASYVHRESVERPFRHVEIAGAHKYSPNIDTTVRSSNANHDPITMTESEDNDQRAQIIDGVNLSHFHQEQCVMFMDYITPPPGYSKPIQALFGTDTKRRDMGKRGLMLGAKELRELIDNKTTVSEMMSELGRMLAMIQYGAMHTANDLEIILGSVPMSEHRVSSSVMRSSSKKSKTKKRHGRHVKPTVAPAESRALRLFFIDFDASEVWHPSANNDANVALLVNALDSVEFFPSPKQKEYYSLFRAAYISEARRHNHDQLAEQVLADHEKYP